uniref:Calponin-homology (CH) domain-containing protein n=1 Tax=Macrostomum lignano TaxID=282301 RepID=A0A1I8FIF8_9PLAT
PPAVLEQEGLNAITIRRRDTDDEGNSSPRTSSWEEGGERRMDWLNARVLVADRMVVPVSGDESLRANGQRQRLESVLAATGTNLCLAGRPMWTGPRRFTAGRLGPPLLRLLWPSRLAARAPIKLPGRVTVPGAGGTEARRRPAVHPPARERVTGPEDVFLPGRRRARHAGRHLRAKPERVGLLERHLMLFINSNLACLNIEVTDLARDLADGVNLIILLGYFVPLHFYTSVSAKEQRVANVSLLFDLMEDAGILRPTTRPEELVAGDLKAALRVGLPIFSNPSCSAVHELTQRIFRLLPLQRWQAPVQRWQINGGWQLGCLIGLRFIHSAAAASAVRPEDVAVAKNSQHFENVQVPGGILKRPYRLCEIPKPFDCDIWLTCHRREALAASGIPWQNGFLSIFSLTLSSLSSDQLVLVGGHGDEDGLGQQGTAGCSAADAACRLFVAAKPRAGRDGARQPHEPVPPVLYRAVLLVSLSFSKADGPAASAGSPVNGSPSGCGKASRRAAPRDRRGPATVQALRCSRKLLPHSSAISPADKASGSAAAAAAADNLTGAAGFADKFCMKLLTMMGFHDFLSKFTKTLKAMDKIALTWPASSRISDLSIHFRFFGGLGLLPQLHQGFNSEKRRRLQTCPG